MTEPFYTAERKQDHGVEIVRLADSAHDVEVLIAPSLGNRAYAMNVSGANILHMPAANISELHELSGIPFLGPWANRIPCGGFRVDGDWYAFNESLGVLRIHPGHIAIHGMLTSSDLWRVTGVGADPTGAWVVSRLEFWRYPRLMANWPFAHEYEMKYRLAGGELTISISVKNLSEASMPISIGFHPYFTIPGVPRDRCVAHIPARKAVVVDDRLCATGELRANSLPDPTPLDSHALDDGFTDLIREEASDEAVFWLEGGGKRIEVVFGAQWQVGIVYAPPGHDFACFEPMAALTNGINLAADGKYADLQMLTPGGVWQGSFRVRALHFQ